MLFDLENYKDILKKENRKALLFYSFIFSAFAITIIGIIAIIISTALFTLASELYLVSALGFIFLLGLILIIFSFITNGIYFSALYRGNNRQYITDVLKLFIKGAGMIFLSLIYAIALLIPLAIFVIFILSIAPFFSTSILLLPFILITIIIGIIYLFAMMLTIMAMQAEYAKEESLQKAFNFSKIIKTAITKKFAFPVIFNWLFVIIASLAFSAIINLVFVIVPLDMENAIGDTTIFLFLILTALIVLLNTIFQMFITIGFNISIAKAYSHATETKHIVKKLVKKTIKGKIRKK